MQIVIDIPEEKYEYIKGLYKACTDYQTTLMLYDAIRNSTPLSKGHGDYQPSRKGHWIITPFSVTGRHYQCSECKYIHTFTNFEYCPKCGARMVKPQESEDKE